MVTDDAARRRAAKFEPHEVVLAVEIVAGSSVSMDRITKPALYAKAGIPYYWRIETEGGIVVHTYRIDPEERGLLLAGRVLRHHRRDPAVADQATDRPS